MSSINIIGTANMDVFIAGDDDEAKEDVSAFVESLGMRPGHRAAVDGAGTGERHPAACGPRRPLRQAHQLLADRCRTTNL
jgi:hypothetical protein